MIKAGLDKKKKNQNKFFFFISIIIINFNRGTLDTI